MAKPTYSIVATINFKQGETYAQHLASGRRATAKYMRELMAWHKSATSFVFTVARVGSAATPNTGGDVE